MERISGLPVQVIDRTTSNTYIQNVPSAYVGGKWLPITSKEYQNSISSGSSGGGSSSSSSKNVYPSSSYPSGAGTRIDYGKTTSTIKVTPMKPKPTVSNTIGKVGTNIVKIFRKIF